MNGHTPGPWMFGVEAWDSDTGNDRISVKPPEYSGDGYSENPYIFGSDGSRVVGCDEYNVFGDWSTEHPGRREADIRLMLAAPDLLAAAVRFMAAGYPPGHDEPVSQAERDEYAEAWRALTAAIAKATGGQP